MERNRVAGMRTWKKEEWEEVGKERVGIRAQVWDHRREKHKQGQFNFKGKEPEVFHKDGNGDSIPADFDDISIEFKLAGEEEEEEEGDDDEYHQESETQEEALLRHFQDPPSHQHHHGKNFTWRFPRTGVGGGGQRSTFTFYAWRQIFLFSFLLLLSLSSPSPSSWFSSLFSSFSAPFPLMVSAAPAPLPLPLPSLLDNHDHDEIQQGQTIITLIDDRDSAFFDYRPRSGWKQVQTHLEPTDRGNPDNRGGDGDARKEGDRDGAKNSGVQKTFSYSHLSNASITFRFTYIPIFALFTSSSSSSSLRPFQVTLDGKHVGNLWDGCGDDDGILTKMIGDDEDNGGPKDIWDALPEAGKHAKCIFAMKGVEEKGDHKVVIVTEGNGEKGVLSLDFAVLVQPPRLPSSQFLNTPSPSSASSHAPSASSPIPAVIYTTVFSGSPSFRGVGHETSLPSTSRLSPSSPSSSVSSGTTLPPPPSSPSPSSFYSSLSAPLGSGSSSPTTRASPSLPSESTSISSTSGDSTVNTESPNTTGTISSSASSQGTTNAFDSSGTDDDNSGRSRSDTGAIVGGVLGGLAIIGVTIFAIIFLLKRHRPGGPNGRGVTGGYSDDSGGGSGSGHRYERTPTHDIDEMEEAPRPQGGVGSTPTINRSEQGSGNASGKFFSFGNLGASNSKARFGGGGGSPGYGTGSSGSGAGISGGIIRGGLGGGGSGRRAHDRGSAGADSAGSTTTMSENSRALREFANIVRDGVAATFGKRSMTRAINQNMQFRRNASLKRKDSAGRKGGIVGALLGSKAITNGNDDAGSKSQDSSGPPTASMREANTKGQYQPLIFEAPHNPNNASMIDLPGPSPYNSTHRGRPESMEISDYGFGSRSSNPNIVLYDCAAGRAPLSAVPEEAEDESRGGVTPLSRLALSRLQHIEENKPLASPNASSISLNNPSASYSSLAIDRMMSNPPPVRTDRLTHLPPQHVNLQVSSESSDSESVPRSSEDTTFSLSYGRKDRPPLSSTRILGLSGPRVPPGLLPPGAPGSILKQNPSGGPPALQQLTLAPGYGNQPAQPPPPGASMLSPQTATSGGKFSTEFSHSSGSGGSSWTSSIPTPASSFEISRSFELQRNPGETGTFGPGSAPSGSGRGSASTTSLPWSPQWHSIASTAAPSFPPLVPATPPQLPPIQSGPPIPPPRRRSISSGSRSTGASVSVPSSSESHPASNLYGDAVNHSVLSRGVRAGEGTGTLLKPPIKRTISSEDFPLPPVG